MQDTNRHELQTNKHELRSNIRDFIGAFGDLGTFAPIFIALVAINGLNPKSILVVSGLLYIACGLYYRLPIPVQPLKAMAAIAISLGLRYDVIQAAGIIIGVILLIISLTNLTKFLPRIFSRPIVRGMQLGVGLMLIKTAVFMILKSPDRHAVITNSIFGISFPQISSFSKAFWLLVLPQLPLTLGNAIVGTCDIARRQFKQRAIRVKERSLSFDLGIVNIISGFISGCIPFCHGSSGLTAHISFGAKSQRATIFTGVLFLITGLIFANNAQAIFKMIPHTALGVMLLYVGLRHALLVNDLVEGREVLLALAIGLSGLLTNNLTLALCLGVSLWHLPQIIQRLAFQLSPLKNLHKV